MTLIAVLLLAAALAPEPKELTLVETISGGLSPKSLVHSGTGLFFAQNMMYLHTVAVYDRDFELVATIPDKIAVDGVVLRGAPVECAFSPDGRYAWVSNYQMHGKGYANPGNDASGRERGDYDDSYLYRIDTQRLKIDAWVKVGAVPKVVATTPDGKLVLVSNWCSSDLSVVDTEKLEEVRSVPLGRHPRGIAVSPDSRTAYIAVMGASAIAVVDLETYAVSWIKGIGSTPRHLCLSPDGSTLYVSLNNAGKVVKLDLATGKVVASARTGSQPRSMALSADGASLFVVNYGSATLTKLRTSDMKPVATAETAENPIGVTFDAFASRVWVACYSGCLQVFQVRRTPSRSDESD